MIALFGRSLLPCKSYVEQDITEAPRKLLTETRQVTSCVLATGWLSVCRNDSTGVRQLSVVPGSSLVPVCTLFAFFCTSNTVHYRKRTADGSVSSTCLRVQGGSRPEELSVVDQEAGRSIVQPYREDNRLPKYLLAHSVSEVKCQSDPGFTLRFFYSIVLSI